MPLVRYLPERTHIGFMRLRRWSFPLSAALALASTLLFAVMGLDYGIDFRGGTLLEVQSTTGPADIGAARERLNALQLGDVQIQEFGSPNELLIRIGTVDTGASGPATNVTELVRDALGESYTIRRVEVVGPSVSNELVQQSVLAVVLGTLAILVYLWLRFEWQFALGAIVTTLHDVLVTLGLFALFQLDFDLTSIAAILTILGYSLNDTVVVYDRIRDMLRRYKKLSLPALLDEAINATFSRTIIVAATTFFATIALYVFGGEVLRGFSLAMLVGVVIGTYSTIFIAAPLLIYFGVRPGVAEDTAQAKAKAVAARP